MQIHGDEELQRTLAKITDTAPAATAFALNGIAFEIRKEVQGELPKWVHLTRNFLPNSVIYERATTSHLAAAVGFHKRADFVSLLEDGGTRTPKGRALAIPVDVKTNQRGGISQANRPSAVMQKPGVFSGVVSGVAGIWQKTKRIPMRLLYAFKPQAKYDQRFLHFNLVADRVAKAQYPVKFKAAILKMITK